MLNPHFQKTVIPGWLDKACRHRHRATAHLDNVIVLSPRAEWIATLPNANAALTAATSSTTDDLARAWRHGRAPGRERASG